MANELVPMCVSIPAEGTLQETMASLVAWCVSNLVGGNGFLRVEATDSSDGSNVDRMLLQDDDGGQIWIGYDSTYIKFLLDPEGELSTAETPTSLSGSCSHLRHCTNAGDGKLLFAAYPDAFFMACINGQTTPRWLFHGGRTLTTWNASDASIGVTGHVLFGSGRVNDSHFGIYTSGNNSSSNFGLLASYGFSLRRGYQEWATDGLSMWLPSTTDVNATGVWQHHPAIIGGSGGTYIGFTRYMRSERENPSYGKVRTTEGSDQAWLCMATHTSSTVDRPWYLWNKNVNPNL